MFTPQHEYTTLNERNTGTGDSITCKYDLARPSFFFICLFIFRVISSSHQRIEWHIMLPNQQLKRSNLHRTFRNLTSSTLQSSILEARHDHAFRPHIRSIQDKWEKKKTINILGTKHVQAQKIVRKKTTIFSSHCPFG